MFKFQWILVGLTIVMLCAVTSGQGADSSAKVSKSQAAKVAKKETNGQWYHIALNKRETGISGLKEVFAYCEHFLDGEGASRYAGNASQSIPILGKSAKVAFLALSTGEEGEALAWRNRLSCFDIACWKRFEADVVRTITVLASPRPSEAEEKKQPAITVEKKKNGILKLTLNDAGVSLSQLALSLVPGGKAFCFRTWYSERTCWWKGRENLWPPFVSGSSLAFAKCLS